jgi:hypothetical protein
MKNGQYDFESAQELLGKVASTCNYKKWSLFSTDEMKLLKKEFKNYYNSNITDDTLRNNMKEFFISLSSKDNSIPTNEEHKTNVLKSLINTVDAVFEMENTESFFNMYFDMFDELLYSKFKGHPSDEFRKLINQTRLALKDTFIGNSKIESIWLTIDNHFNGYLKKF